MSKISECEVENLTLSEIKKLGFYIINGIDISPDSELSHSKEVSKRNSYSDVILEDVLMKSIDRLNPDLPESAKEQAFKTVLRIYSPQLIDANEIFHKMLTEGISVNVQKDNAERGEKVWIVDFQNPENNIFHAINQFTIVDKNQNKRPDIILFVNGLPLVVIELKNPADEQATLRKAYDQIQTYKSVIPILFHYNSFCIISDGLEANAGTISSPFSRFMPWKTSDGNKEASSFINQLEVMIKGMLNKKTLLDLIRNFIVFEKDKKIDTKTGLISIENTKKIAAYHQFYAVNKAVESTKKASSNKGNRKAGVIWHTQGSGKSLSMVFYTGKLITELNNPTIVVLTDRNDLDEQLFDTFASSTQLLRQTPVKAGSRDSLKSLLKVASGGIVFTTIQKFFPDSDNMNYDTLSERKNIIIIADEAHRTQYGFKAKLVDVKDIKGNISGKRISYGFAKYLRDAIPNATFIGFTGTPVEKTDVNTPAVFGDYIDIYDIAQAVDDKATVPIYYESRLAKINITAEGKKLIEEIDREMEENEVSDSEKAKAKWTKLEAIVGHPERIKNLARDIIMHFELRNEVFDGKAMIVAMSRRIAVELYKEIINLKPEWHSDDLAKGKIKVVMTSASSDKLEFDPEDPDSLVIPLCHRTNKDNRKLLSERMKDPVDSLKIVIVRDMWLTGFDVPCLHTLYIDKLMKGHTLMQAIARVNRVFLDKPGGLIVDYIGIGTALKEALSFYSNSGGKGEPAETQEKALELLNEKIEITRQMLHGFNYQLFFSGTLSDKLSLILKAEDYILSLENGKERYLKVIASLSKAFALSIPHEDALKMKDDIAFFQAIQARLMKFDTGEDNSNQNYNTIIRQIINQAVESNEVIDIFNAAGIKKPNIELLSDEFLLEVKQMEHKNLAFELLRKILNDEINARLTHNITEGRKLLEMLENSIKKYHNNLITTAEIIEELIDLAKDIKDCDSEAEKLKLTKDEYAFYSALETNDSAVQVLGNDTLRTIAKEIADKVRSNATIDWTLKESVRAKLMVIVRRTLNKYGYPPDKQKKAIDTVMKQAEILADKWAS